MRFAPVFIAALLLAACESSSVRHEAEATPVAASATCPVSGEEARSDISLVYEGRTVNFCCEKCLKSFKANPEQFLANFPVDEEKPVRPEGSSSR